MKKNRRFPANRQNLTSMLPLSALILDRRDALVPLSDTYLLDNARSSAFTTG